MCKKTEITVEITVDITVKFSSEFHRKITDINKMYAERNNWHGIEINLNNSRESSDNWLQKEQLVLAAKSD